MCVPVQVEMSHHAVALGDGVDPSVQFRSGKAANIPASTSARPGAARTLPRQGVVLDKVLNHSSLVALVEVTGR